VDVTRSDWLSTLEDGDVRIGLLYVKGLREEKGKRIAAERASRPFASLQDFVDRVGLRQDEVRRLAEVGALNAFGLTRRSALWQVEKAGRPRGPLLRDADDDEETGGPQEHRAGHDGGLDERSEDRVPVNGGARSPLADMTVSERLGSDLLGTGLTVGPHPVSLWRDELASRGVVRASEVPRRADGSWIRVAGAVICRQRPGTAKGFLFMTLEDETGLVNIIVRPDTYHALHAVLLSADVLEIDGVLQNQNGCSVLAKRARSALSAEVAGTAGIRSRDFH
jgi:error-prone DNA polymerase